MMMKEGESAIAPPQPRVHSRLEILSCEWKEDGVSIVYRCCSNTVNLRVYRNGENVVSVEPLSQTAETRQKVVQTSWVGARVSIVSTCEYNAGCRFTRQDGGSMSLTSF